MNTKLAESIFKLYQNYHQVLPAIHNNLDEKIHNMDKKKGLFFVSVENFDGSIGN